MADAIDVANALVAQAALALYPNGLGQPSVAGFSLKLYPGWPMPEQLDADLAAGIAHVSVFPRDQERNTTRYPKQWIPQTLNVATLALMVSGRTVTVSGAMPAPFTPHVLSVLANGKPYPYLIQPTDTLNSIAAALAALIAAGVPGTVAAGAVITLPSSARINAARVGITGTAIRETRRQERVFQITVWANSPASRDAVAQPLDAFLSGVERMTMPDGFSARLRYQSSPMIDSQQKARLYRRDFLYTVEYATTQTEVETQITQGQINSSTTTDGSTQYSAVTTTYS